MPSSPRSKSQSSTRNARPESGSSAWKAEVRRATGQTIDQWRSVAQGGLVIEPLYHPDADSSARSEDSDAFAGALSRPQPSWSISHRVAAPNTAECARLAHHAFSSGADEVELEVGLEKQTGVRARAAYQELLTAMQGRRYFICPVDHQLPVATGFAAAAADSQHNPEGAPTSRFRGGILVDPIGRLIRGGRLEGGHRRSQRHLADWVAWCKDHLPGYAAVSANAEHLLEAGAPPVLQVACAAATAVAYLRDCDRAGLAPEHCADRLVFHFAVGDDLFIEAAKLRAVRLVWSTIRQAMGLPGDPQHAHVRARSCARSQSGLVPWLNPVRTATQVLAAGLGGADAISARPFDEAAGVANDAGHLLAIHTQLLIRDEGQVGRVRDPLQGSWYVEQMTGAIAEQAWQAFQRIEAEGGMWAWLLKGRLYEALRDARSEERSPLVGVTDYVEPDMEGLQRPAHPAEPLPLRLVPGFLLDDTQPVALGDPTAEQLQAMAALEEAAGEDSAAGEYCQAAVGAARLQLSPESIVELSYRGAPLLTLAPVATQAIGQAWERSRQLALRWKNKHGKWPRVAVVDARGEPWARQVEAWLRAAGFEVLPLPSPGALGDTRVQAAVAVPQGDGGAGSDLRQLRHAGATIVGLALPAAPSAKSFSEGADFVLAPSYDNAAVLNELHRRLDPRRVTVRTSA